MKNYNVKDGMGISLLKKNNIEVGVISGYKSNNSQKKNNWTHGNKICFVKHQR